MDRSTYFPENLGPNTARRAANYSLERRISDYETESERYSGSSNIDSVAN
jgi:hypothetical protein